MCARSLELKISLAFLFLLAALFWHCSENPAHSPPSSEPIDITEAEKDLIEFLDQLVELGIVSQVAA